MGSMAFWLTRDIDGSSDGITKYSLQGGVCEFSPFWLEVCQAPWNPQLQTPKLDALRSLSARNTYGSLHRSARQQRKYSRSNPRRCIQQGNLAAKRKLLHEVLEDELLSSALVGNCHVPPFRHRSMWNKLSQLAEDGTTSQGET